MQLNQDTSINKLIKLLTVSGEISRHAAEILLDIPSSSLPVILNRMRGERVFETSEGKKRVPIIRGINIMRFTKKFTKVLQAIDANMYEQVRNATSNFRYPNSETSARRTEVSEIAAMMMRMNIPIPANENPSYKGTEKRMFFSMSMFKRDLPIGKSASSRMRGILLNGSEAYVMYYVSKESNIWAARGEEKIKLCAKQFCSVHAPSVKQIHAIITGREASDLELCLQTGRSRKQIGYNGIYEKTHFIPLTQNGMHLLEEILQGDNMTTRILFPDPEDGFFDYISGTEHHLVALDADLNKLAKLKKMSMLAPQKKYIVYTYSWQVEHIKKFLAETDIEIRAAEQEGVIEETWKRRRK